MAVQIRDSGGVLRTLAGLKIRDGSGTIRTLANVKIRDAGGVLRTVYTAGGGGGTSVWIDPPSTSTRSTTQHFHLADFTVGHSGGVAPSSYVWGVLAGVGSIYSGQGTATGRLRVEDPDGTGIHCDFYCDVTISGTVYRAYCSMDHTFFDGFIGGGSP